MSSTIPKRLAPGLAVAWLLLDGGAALAQANPKFEYLKKADADKAQWKASASAGALLATGNANSFTVNGSGSIARVDPRNKLALDVNGAWGQTTTTTFVDRIDPSTMMGNGAVDDAGELGNETKTTTQVWAVKLRYDRFFSPNNVGYLSTLVGSNELAGKRLFGNAQIGYVRQLYHSDRNELFLEAGYDFTYEFYKEGSDPSWLPIHSLRLFFGHNLKLTPDTGLFTGIEGLFNVAPLDPPGFAKGTVGPFEDTRINFKTALNTKLYKSLSFRFSFTALFDNIPAPRPLPPDIKLAKDAQGMEVPPPLAQKLDTLSEAALVVTFL
jgi:hypothetical protein